MRHDIDRALALTLAWAVFLVCCILPLVWVAAASRGGSSEALGLLTSARQRSLLVQTVMLGAGASAGAVAAGVPLGFVLARCDPRRLRLARFALLVPLVLPSYVVTLAWVLMVETTFGTWTYSLPAAMAVLAMSYYPIVMLTAESALRATSARLEDAASLVASSRRVWFTITLPLIAPVVMASAVLVFVLAISDFAVPSMLRVRVYTTEVFTAFAGLYDFWRAALLAIPIAAVGALATIAIVVLTRQQTVARTGHGPAGRQWTSTFQQRVAVVVTLFAATSVSLVVGPIATQALSGRASWVNAASAKAIANSVIWSASAATIALMVGAVLGYWRSRNRGPAGIAADMIWLGLFATPATVAGVGLVAMWNRTGIIGELYRTDASIVIAYTSRFIPVAALLCAIVFRRVPIGAEEAASVGGASWARTFSHVVLPLARRGITAVWLVVFILMFGDVSLSILVSPPGESNLAVRAYTLMANSPVGEVARIALAQTAMALLPLSAIMVLLRDRVSGQ